MAYTDGDISDVSPIFSDKHCRTAPKTIIDAYNRSAKSGLNLMKFINILSSLTSRINAFKWAIS